jgi:acetate kinase
MASILTINAGSSSIKAALFSAEEPLHELFVASIEDIGTSPTLYTSLASKGNATDAQSHQQAFKAILQCLEPIIHQNPIAAVGHRVVHGGEMFTEPTAITVTMLDQLKTLKTIDPNHLPAAIDSMTLSQQVFTGIPQIACFDTSFFHNIPLVAQTIALPRIFREQGLRRYGFHGLSYTYLLRNFAQHEGEAAARGKVIMAHLGSGASIAATTDGQAVDMTMGLSPTSGLTMSTRSGDIDPGVVEFLHAVKGITIPEFSEIVNKQSGLLGVSGTTADMHWLLQNQASDPRAAEAVELFCYQARKAIGSLSAALGGINSLIFSGGIGERSAEIRERICQDLQYLGVIIDPARNSAGDRLISADDSSVGVHVIHTNEAYTIAHKTFDFICKQSKT